MKRTLALFAATTALTAPAFAEELSVVGSWSSLPLHNQYEAPYWSEKLPAASGGNITVALTTHNQMNLGVGDVYRLLGDGVYDVAMTVADYAVGDAPERGVFQPDPARIAKARKLGQDEGKSPAEGGVPRRIRRVLLQGGLHFRNRDGFVINLERPLSFVVILRGVS